MGVMYAGMVIFRRRGSSRRPSPALSSSPTKCGRARAGWVDQFNDWAQRNLLGARFIDPTSAAEAASATGTSLTEWAENVLGLASSGIGFVFNLATIAVFTFYFAADAPGIQVAASFLYACRPIGSRGGVGCGTRPWSRPAAPPTPGG